MGLVCRLLTHYGDSAIAQTAVTRGGVKVGILQCTYRSELPLPRVMVGKSTGVCDITTSRLQTLRLNISSAHLYVFQPERKLAFCLTGSTAARFRGMAAMWTSRLSLIVWLSLLTGRYKTTYMTPIESLPVSGRTTIFTNVEILLCNLPSLRYASRVDWSDCEVKV